MLLRIALKLLISLGISISIALDLHDFVCELVKQKKSSRPSSLTSKPSPTMTKDVEKTSKVDTRSEDSERSFLLLDDKEKLQVSL